MSTKYLSYGKQYITYKRYVHDLSEYNAMKSMADKDNVASDFLFTIQALAISSRAAGKIDNLRLTIFLSLAAGASRELPEGEDAFSCALMFAEAYLPEHASTRAAPGYKVAEVAQSRYAARGTASGGLHRRKMGSL